MFQPQLSLPARFFQHPQQLGWAVTISLITWLVGTLVVAGTLSVWAGYQLTRGQVPTPKLLEVPRHILTPLSVVTFHQLPSLELWQGSLELTQTLLSTQPELTQLLTQTFNLDQTDQKSLLTPTQKLFEYLPQLQRQATRFDQNWQKDSFFKWLVKRFSPTTFTALSYSAQPLSLVVGDITTLTQTFSHGRHDYIVLLQNSHELRASGGFMGSFAKITIQDGVIADWSINDIYQPDGQFTGYVAAPAGVKEYLSSGQGLRLPDANWHPDFPSSAQTILSYFAFGKQSQIEGVVALNLATIEHILAVTGPIKLSDYDVAVTSENLAQVARADRSQFFPGSYQKPQFLRALAKQLQLQIAQLSPAQKMTLARQLWQDIQHKQLQFYASDTNMQSVWQKYGVAGQLDGPPQSELLALVESNVGINKVNLFVDRQVAVNIDDYRVGVTIEFNNQSKELGYVNYQRVLVPPYWSLHQVQVNGQKILQPSDELISTTADSSYRQVGWLVTVPATQTTQTTIEFLKPALAELDQIYVFKQSGLPPTPYTLTFPDHSDSLVLEKDTLIRYNGGHE